MTVAFISIGSNVGDRTGFSRRAVDELNAHPNINVTAVSSLYETSPVGGPPQRSFINLVARLDTKLGARELLETCQEIERLLGRESSDIRWGPRVVDLDIVLFGDEKISEPDLEIPHPRMNQRKFVLVPLLEIDPTAVDPWGTPFAGMVAEAEGDVEKLEEF
jgi:2-amino-4-hydroxy-6-hydroxymethyldihydropteridine diphosphokinase